MRRHISSRARIGLRSGERVGIGTVSTTVARSFNGNARSSSQVKVLVGHQRASLAQELRMHVPLTLERFTRSASDQDGHLRMTCVQVPIQSARSCDVGDGRSRYMRKRHATTDRHGKRGFRVP